MCLLGYGRNLRRFILVTLSQADRGERAKVTPRSGMISERLQGQRI